MSSSVLSGIGCYSPQTARDRSMWQRLTDFCTGEPQAFDRNPETGHVTGSAFVLSADRSSVLLTHHRKLNRWFQLGGHCDGIADVPFVALKEAYEESGLVRIRPLSAQVFDVDIHEIPQNANECAHLHYDVRYLFHAEAGEIAASGESHALAWVPLSQLEEVTDSPGVLVLRDKLEPFLSAYC
ncbi:MULTISPECIES: NUDIX hydrolase [unclassified Leisingera]|uniref:NUDIX hydrolase n=1 Tax=unclassified Leisingera TaxID=2614906 RepID=UPI00057F14C0|nr:MULTISPECIES: NUDIX hydrolase [unclassified Leisingera]KIC30082.1 NUDIX hydrolase [Leisingera sp. ANG-M6]KIC34719.1 NUDIX hydrolase [Leisingera sp. ANG-S5]